MLNEFVYCPRLFYLEWVQSEWADSADTVAGASDHRRVDVEQGSLPEPSELAGEGFEARSVLLGAPEEGLIARIDLLEARDGEVVPVDYKHGRPPDKGAWDADRIQIGAQALILREKGYRCRRGVVYYVAAKRRVEIVIDDALAAETRENVSKAWEATENHIPPAPLVDSPKCPRCSLVGICLPDEQNLLAAVEPSPKHDVRRLYPAKDDALPLYIQAQGARLGKAGDELEIVERDQGTRRVRMMDVSQVALFGNVHATANAVSELLARGIPICHFSYGNWFRGITQGLGNRNCELRLHQYRTVIDAGKSLRLARGFVSRKIRNARTLLRRNGVKPGREVLEEMNRIADLAEKAPAQESLLGIEGVGARLYFQSFSSMLKASRSTFDFELRNRRPPRDPVNALLSLAYSVLARDWTVVLLAVGLDPFLGFYHRPRFGRPALALDLMEEFRPLIADSVVLQVINNGEVQEEDFIKRGDAVALTQDGRRKFFLAYERRMAHLVTHPIFGYRVSYRRLLEVQARLVARFLTGELSAYDGFRTR
jgi:CRISPR-associated protein Cas1